MKNITNIALALGLALAITTPAFAGENKESLSDTLKNAVTPKTPKLKLQATAGGAEFTTGLTTNTISDVKKSALVSNSTKQLEAFQGRLLSTTVDIHPVALMGTEAELSELNHRLAQLKIIPEREQLFIHAAEIGATEEKIASLKRTLALQRQLLKAKEEVTALQLLQSSISDKQQIEKLSERALSGRSNVSFNFLDQNTKNYKKFSRLGLLSKIAILDGTTRLTAAIIGNDVGVTALDDLGSAIYDHIEKRIHPRTPATTKATSNLASPDEAELCEENQSVAK